MNVYFISGLGAGEKVFEHIVLPEGYQKNFLPWLVPHKKESLVQYAQRMAEPIDVSQPFILMGLSFGGIIAQEINQLHPAEKIIIISSLKSPKEKPRFFNFSCKTQCHRLIPAFFFTSKRTLSYAFFRKLYSKRMPDFDVFFEFRNAYYIKWSIHQIIHWKPNYNTPETLYHIHGEKDPIFPIYKIKNAFIVPNGNHIMILTKHKYINSYIQEILENTLV